MDSKQPSDQTPKHASIRRVGVKIANPYRHIYHRALLAVCMGLVFLNRLHASVYFVALMTFKSKPTGHDGKIHHFPLTFGNFADILWSSNEPQCSN